MTSEQELILRKILAEKSLSPNMRVTEWKKVPSKAIWPDINIKALLPTTAMAEAFWAVFNKRFCRLEGSSGYYESFGAAYEAMLEAADESWQSPKPTDAECEAGKSKYLKASVSTSGGIGTTNNSFTQKPTDAEMVEMMVKAALPDSTGYTTAEEAMKAALQKLREEGMI